MADRVLIIEPYTTGHRGVWLKWMAEGLAGKGWHVAVSTLKESVVHPTLRELAHTRLAIRVFSSDPPPRFAPALNRGLPRRDHAYRNLMRFLFLKASESDPKVVLVPYLDYCLYSTAILGSPFGHIPWAGVALRPSFHYAACGIHAPIPTLASVREAIFSYLMRSNRFRTCFTIDEPLYDYWHQTHPRQSSKLVLMPDPIRVPLATNREAARQRLGVQEKQIAILVFGRISGRKGLTPLFDAVDRLSLQHSLCVLIVGEQDPGARQYLDSPAATRLRSQGIMIERDGWAGPEVESDAFAACDIVWMGYQDHWQSSGVQIQAAMAAKPVAASDAGIIGWQTRRHHCGLTLDISNPVSVDSTLEKLLSSESLRVTLGENGLRYAARHTTENAISIIDAGLRTR